MHKLLTTMFHNCVMYMHVNCALVLGWLIDFTDRSRLHNHMTKVKHSKELFKKERKGIFLQPICVSVMLYNTGELLVCKWKVLLCRHIILLAPMSYHTTDTHTTVLSNVITINQIFDEQITGSTISSWQWRQCNLSIMVRAPHVYALRDKVYATKEVA